MHPDGESRRRKGRDSMESLPHAFYMPLMRERVYMAK